MSSRVYKIGVFDSGIGGKSVALAIKKQLPEVDIFSVSDRKNSPYGSKSAKELQEIVEPILLKLSEHVDCIVIACNTVSTTIATHLRTVISIPVVMMEPMIKPAATYSGSGIIAVCATPATLASARYNWLKQEYAPDMQVLEPDCSDWSMMIERNELNTRKVRSQISELCAQGADVIVLGCTHYHWIESLINEIVGEEVLVLQPEVPVIAQLERVLARLE